MSQELTLAILAAGKVKSDEYASIFNTVPAMIPFNGKPLIYQTILDFIKNKLNRKIYLSLPFGEEHVEQFLHVAFDDRIDLDCIYFQNAHPHCQAETLMGIFKQMAQKNAADCPLLVANGDLFYELPETFDAHKVVAFIRESVLDSHCSHFCISSQGKVKYFGIEQKPNVVDCEYFTDCGVYYIPSWKDIYERALGLDDFDYTVGELLCNLTNGDINLVPLKTWLDLGDLDSAATIATKVLGAREFNQLRVDERLGLITKSSRNKDKILQEINYYSKLLPEVAIFFPRLYNFEVGKSVSYTIEYYPYKTLSEYFVMHDLSERCWIRVFDKIFDIYSNFKSIKGPLPTREGYDRIYMGKMFDRLEGIRSQDDLYDLTTQDRVIINGTEYLGWKYYIPFIQEIIHNAYNSCECSVIHGDMCFSNILYEPSTNTVKFIDPRGEFFEEGIFV